LSASSIGSDADDEYGTDDIDDYNGSTATVTLYANENISTCEGNYIDLNISIVTSVDYLDDTPHSASGTTGSLGETTNYSNVFDYISGHTSNIKAISVLLTSANPASELSFKKIRLSAFMCNIGAPRKYYSKEY
jgi:hypothetical protein